MIGIENGTGGGNPIINRKIEYPFDRHHSVGPLKWQDEECGHGFGGHRAKFVWGSTSSRLDYDVDANIILQVEASSAVTMKVVSGSVCIFFTK